MITITTTQPAGKILIPKGLGITSNTIMGQCEHGTSMFRRCRDCDQRGEVLAVMILKPCAECTEYFTAAHDGQTVCPWCLENTCIDCGYSIKAHTAWCSTEKKDGV